MEEGLIHGQARIRHVASHVFRCAADMTRPVRGPPANGFKTWSRRRAGRVVQELSPSRRSVNLRREFEMFVGKLAAELHIRHWEWRADCCTPGPREKQARERKDRLLHKSKRRKKPTTRVVEIRARWVRFGANLRTRPDLRLPELPPMACPTEVLLLPRPHARQRVQALPEASEAPIHALLEWRCRRAQTAGT